MYSYRAEPADVTQTFVRAEGAPDIDNETFNQGRAEAKTSSIGQPSGPAGGRLKSLNVGVVDHIRLARECLASGLSRLHPEIRISSFADVQACVDALPDEFDLIICRLPDNDALGMSGTQIVTALNRVAPKTPIMAISEADCATDRTIVRSILESGARGFVPTQTATLSMIWAAIELVIAGGTFLPPDLMLTTARDPSLDREKKLTARQSAVFKCMQSGQANKAIAYELGMCEATVKVHVKNIMRKVGATNRTQAAYKGQRFLREAESARM